jgi:hypothetical protein
VAGTWAILCGLPIGEGYKRRECNLFIHGPPTAHPGPVPELEYVILMGVPQPLEADAWRALANCRWLNTVFVPYDMIDDGGLAELARCEQLELVRLANNQRLTSAGLAPLSALRWLRDLSVAGSKLGDEAVEPLQKLTALRILNVRQTRLTPAGIARLKQALPHCAIFHDDGLELPEPLPSK